MIDEREEENGEEYIPVETGEEFWKPINRGEVVEPGRELGERIGLMEEDAGRRDFFVRFITPFANGGANPVPNTPKGGLLMFWKKKKAKAKDELVSVETEGRISRGAR